MPTSTPSNVFLEEIIKGLPGMFENASKEAAILIWSVIKSLLIEWWPWILGVLFIFFFLAVTKALFGQWGMLGSLLYNVIYFGILLLIVLIFGPEVFVNDYFNLAMAAMLYPLVYFIVGLVLTKLRVRRRF